jgi:hypothetical protein
MVLQSKFKFWVLLTISLLLGATALLALMLKVLFVSDKLPGIEISVFLFIFTITWMWVVFGELRTKAIQVTIKSGEIVVSRYCGLAKAITYDFARFEGFHTALLTSKYGTYEYLYLIEDSKRKVAISQFYHRNYSDLKEALEGQLHNLGNRRVSFGGHVYDVLH